MPCNNQHKHTFNTQAMANTLDFIVAIPARYAASRLPGKPLRLIGGEPMVLHVAKRALAAGARAVWVATSEPLPGSERPSASVTHAMVFAV